MAPLALVAAIVLSQVDHGPRALVGMPAANAAPAQVVATYVRALDAHDFRTAERLLVPGVRDTYRHTWFLDVDHVGSLTVGRVRAERPSWSGRNHRTEVQIFVGNMHRKHAIWLEMPPVKGVCLSRQQVHRNRIA